MLPDLASTSSVHGTTWTLDQHNLHDMATGALCCQISHKPLFSTQPSAPSPGTLCPGLLCSLDRSSTPLPPVHPKLDGKSVREAAGLHRGASLSLAPSVLSLDNTAHWRSGVLVSDDALEP